MKKIILASVFLVLSVVSGYIIISNTPKKKLKIGYIGSISGKFSVMGTSARNGAILAVEEINSRNGISGQKIELVVKDDEAKPEKVISICEEFKREGVKHIIGPFTTASATHVLPCINEKGLLTIGPVTAGDNLAGIDDLFVKLFPSTREFGEALAKLAVKKKIGSFAIINDQKNKPFGDTLISGFRPVFVGPGRNIIANIDYISGTGAKISKLAEQATKNKPEGALIIANAIDSALIIQHIKKRSPKTKIFVSPWSMSRELVTSGGKYVEGTFSYIPFDQQSTHKRYLTFKKAYIARFKVSPPFVAAFNYEAVYLLKTIMKKSGSLKPQVLVKSLLDIKKFKGLQADYSFNRFGDAKRTLFLYEIKNNTISKVL